MNGQGSGGSGRKAPGRVAGEIVEVEGGHIIRSTGRKDRHSKVCTAKGPRDRRVRLSAHTAIQFYDVQDRLGYDRPSKAVDWLINKAKSAIDELDELPPWKPVATAENGKTLAGDGVYVGNNDERCSLLPPASIDSDSIADTTAADQAVQFHSNRSQDLKLSLQSFQDPEQQQQQQFGFDNPNGWEETQPPDLSRFQRLISWNLAGAGGYSTGGESNGGGFMLIPPPQQPPTHFFTQRGTLQSNNTACINGENSVNNNYQDHHHHQFHQAVAVQPVTFAGIGFASTSGGFSGFQLPARIQGDHHLEEEEEQDGGSDKPSSVASTSRH